MFHINLRPNDRQLRQFGFLAVLALPLLIWLWSGNLTAVVWSLPFSLLLGCIAGTCPRWLKPLFIGVTIITFPIGLVIGELSLLMIFYGLLVPIGLVFRIMGRDALHLKRRSRSGSFWRRRRSNTAVQQYYRQS